MRRLRVLFLVLVVGLVLASCGGGESSDTTAAPDDGGSETTATDSGSDDSGSDDSGSDDSGSDDSGSDGSELPTRDEIVAAAEQESGELIVAGSFEDSMIEAFQDGFRELYPFTEPVFIDVSSSESPTVLLELGAGRHRTDLIKIEEGTAMPEYEPHMQEVDLFGLIELGAGRHRTDLIKIEEGTAMPEYEPHMQEVDLFGLIESGAFENLRPEMVDPETGKLFAYATYLGVTSWNTDRIAEFGIDMSEVETWEDILELCDSSLPAGELVMDVNADMEAPLNIAKGEEWAADFAADLVERCEPTFSRGGSGRIAGLASGEFTINLVGNNHHALRVEAEGAPIELKFLTPITGKTSGFTGINNTTERPNQALLMVDYLASAEAQQIMDELNPAGSFQGNGDPIPQNEGLTNSEAVEGHETTIMDWEHAAEYPRWIETMLEAWGFPTGEGE